MAGRRERSARAGTSRLSFDLTAVARGN